MSFISSPFPSCFRPSKTSDHRPPPPISGNPNLTTYIYQTDAGTVSLTWSRSILGRTLHVHLHNNHHHHPFDPDPSSSSSFHLHIKPFVFFWKKKHGSKKLSHNTLLFWNLSKARFGSGPEPEPHSRFYVALVVDHALTLLVGDMDSNARAKYCKATELPPKNLNQVLVLKREHVDVVDARNGNGSSYATKTRFGGKVREIEIDCGDNNSNNSSRLLFSVDGERVLEVKRLKWKFRGNERVEVDGVFVQISWDVHDWVFENNGGGGGGGGGGDGHAVFMFKFEENEVRGGKEGGGEVVNVWNLGSCCELGKTGKSWSSSSLSMSSSAGSFGGSSSVMEWSSVEENELVVPLGFSLLVYAWKR